MVSVLIPNYNNAKWLPECIESCIVQGELLHEIIVVDDHSKDESVVVLNNLAKIYPDRLKVFINPDKGANHARNYAFSKSTGKYIQWLDSDDYLLPGKFQKQVNALDESGNDIAYSDFRFDFYKDAVFDRKEIKNFGISEDYLEELLKDNWNAAHSYLVRKSLAEKLDNCIGWNPETKVGQDREYFTMAGILGATFEYVPGIFAVYNKQESGTISGMHFNKRLELNQILEGRFNREINKQNWISIYKKKVYLAILNTHKLKACFYHDKIKLDKPISPFGIQWSLMHWKMRMAIPLLLISKNIKFYLRGE